MVNLNLLGNIASIKIDPLLLFKYLATIQKRYFETPEVLLIADAKKRKTLKSINYADIYYSKGKKMLFQIEN